ncbi:hypothetical protein RIR_jg4064.t1 [Rhizophagus irregularis DAOM 181602=DAOM 197198]|nr:hypothetical protein RIR_jg4064.t1 [Rhizophagus irregularis DAOM 181602=DAOM 197198]
MSLISDEGRRDRERLSEKSSLLRLRLVHLNVRQTYCKNLHEYVEVQPTFRKIIPVKITQNKENKISSTTRDDTREIVTSSYPREDEICLEVVCPKRYSPKLSIVSIGRNPFLTGAWKVGKNSFLKGSRSFTKAQKILNEFMNINISSINETTSPRSSSSPFISDGNVDNPLQSIDIFLQD